MPDDGQGSAPAGGGAAPAAPSGGAPAQAQPIALTPTSAFIPPGAKEPVTWDKFQSGYIPKDEFTRMRQRDAAERQAWQQQTQQRIEREAQDRYRQQVAQQQGQSQANDYLGALEKAPYVEGKVVAGIVREVAQQLAQTQQALRLMHQQNQQLQQHFTGLNGKAQEQELGNLFATTKRSLQLPDAPIVNELLLDIYHSYTGWESEPGAFQNMVAARWRDLQAALRSLDKQRAQQAAQPRAVGNGLSRNFRPPHDVKGGEPAEVLSARLFAAMQQNGSS